MMEQAKNKLERGIKKDQEVKCKLTSNLMKLLTILTSVDFQGAFKKFDKPAQFYFTDAIALLTYMVSVPKGKQFKITIENKKDFICYKVSKLCQDTEKKTSPTRK